jgi:hypothetical protein
VSVSALFFKTFLRTSAKILKTVTNIWNRPVNTIQKYCFLKAETSSKNKKRIQKNWLKNEK